MFIAPFDHYAPAGALHLIWSLVGEPMPDAVRIAAGLAQGTAVLVDRDAVEALRANAPGSRLFVLEGGQIVRLSAEGRAMDRFHLCENELPSQVATQGVGQAVALDLVMAATSDAAWAEMESLTQEGLPAPAAAAALVGTPAEVAARLEAYRAGGVRHIVVTAPAARAPYELARKELVPLLTRRPGTTETMPTLATIGTQAITWHGVAL